MALWQKVKKLDQKSLSEITNFYSYHGIPVELRDLCAIWIESSIKYLQPELFISGLRGQIQERISSQGDNESIIPFYIKYKLLEFQNTLGSLSQGTNATLSAQDLHARFISCLEKETALLKSHDDQRNPRQGMVVGQGSPSRGINPQIQGTSFSRSSLRSSWSSVSSPPQSQQPGSSFSVGSSPLMYPQANMIMEPRESYQSYSPSEFLNNPVRIIVDNEMHRIYEAVWCLEDVNNTFAFKCHEYRRYQDMISQQMVVAQTNPMQQSHHPNLTEFQEQVTQTRKEILQAVELICGKISEVRSRTPTVLQNWMLLKSELDADLFQWTQDQRQFANGKNMTMSINKLQHLSEYLMEVAHKLRQHLRDTDKIRHASMGIDIVADLIKRSTMMSTEPDIPEQLMKLTNLIKQLVQDTFIVIHQPCQVLRNNTRFHVAPGKNEMEVGLLVGDKLGLQLTPPSVSVIIIDQDTCKNIEIHGLKGDQFKKIQTKGGRLLPKCTRLDLSPQTKRFAAVFRQISLKDYFRNGRKGTMGKEQSECVTEEKLCLLFRCEFTVGDISFQIWRTSLPIVITTHVSQDCLAWAVITWDNAFAQPRRIPFHVPDYATWNQISQVLNYKFESMVGAHLSQENLVYFADRLSKSPGFPDRLSYTELCKINLPDRKFTFWEWFFEAAKLIEQHLKDAWKDGCIMGFVDKEIAKNMLCNGCSPGTFLLRFSDTVLGAISIVWLHSDGKAYSLSPFKGKDLITQPIAEKLDQETLHFVYPNVPKEEAFKKYFDEYKSTSKATQSAAIDDYVRVRNQLIIDNPNIPKFCLMDKTTRSTSGNYEFITPQHVNSPGTSYASQSPDTSRSTENTIEIDIDDIVRVVTSSPGYLECIASPDTTTMQSQSSPLSIQPGSVGDNSRVGNTYCSPPEETFYFDL